MPESKQLARYQWIRPILEGDLSILEVAKVCPFSVRAIKYWLARYREFGFPGLLDKSTKPHNSPKKTDQEITGEILRIREEDKLGGKKIFWKLQDEGIQIGERTVNYILKREGKTRVYRKSREYIIHHKYNYQPGEMVEIDVKYGIHFSFDRWWYQYSAIDLASRWRFLKGYQNQENDYTIDFVRSLLERTKDLFPIKAIKTDNGSIFTNRLTGYLKSSDPLNPRLHALDELLNQKGIAHYLIEPGHPQQNGTVERSHRTDKDYFYKELVERPKSVEEYNYKLRLWNNWYNDLAHCSLNGLSPNQYLRRGQ